MDVDPGHDEIECDCCPKPVKLGIHPWLDIHNHVPHGDARLLVLLYHNWLMPHTAYIVFGRTYRIPRKPLEEWLERQAAESLTS